MYKTDEEKENQIQKNVEEYNEITKEFDLPAYTTLKTKDVWCHLHPNIMGSGRCGHYMDPKLTEE